MRAGEAGNHAPLDADDKGQLGLGGHKVGAVGLCGTLSLDDIALGLAVLLRVTLGALEDDAPLLLVGLRTS